MNSYLGTLGSPKDKATIEHLNRKGPFYWDDGLKVEDLVICCGSRNSSRGTKKLSDWFNSKYCVERGIGDQPDPRLPHRARHHGAPRSRTLAQGNADKMHHSR
jgi:hypothetical protein